ncbi:tyrosine-type recombinase/integrase [Pseudahrensia aquimaris]|uniref:Tyrosine-type recombinase/integrase n=1 Tax=Pseudahrensia aquimaris TaxID=744461 RepID=A0ABW3FEW1_9HYPH
MKYDKTPFARSSIYKLVKSDNGIFYIVWVDTFLKRTRRKSTKTRNETEAHTTFRIFLDLTDDPTVDPAAVKLQEKPLSLFAILDLYQAKEGYKLASFATVEASIKKIKEFGADCLVHHFSDEKQNVLVESWSANGLARGTSERYLAVIRTAINWAHKQKLIANPIEVQTVQSIGEKEMVEPKGDPISIEQMAKLLDNVKSYHVNMTLLLLMNTVSRVSAVLELKADQVNLATGVVTLNQRHRVQTNKRRPTVLLTETLRPWLAFTGSTGHFVTFNGHPIKSSKKALKSLSDNDPAFKGMNINTYSWRHSIARYLKNHGVHLDDISLLLGHKPPKVNPTTLIYAIDYDEPIHLEHATKVLEKMIYEIDSHCKINSPIFEKSPWAPR